MRATTAPQCHAILVEEGVDLRSGFTGTGFTVSGFTVSAFTVSAFTGPTRTGPPCTGRTCSVTESHWPGFLFAATVLSVSLLTAGWLTHPAAGQENWTGFRGDGSGIVKDVELPTEWSPGENIAWRTEIPGYGQSAPVTWGDKIFVTSTDGPLQETLRVHAVERSTGEIIWSKEFDASTPVENYFRNSRAAPTCVVDDQAVYTFFASGDVTAFTHNGETLWSLPLLERYGAVVNERGVASSPAQTDSHLFIVIDHEGPSYIAAVNKESGEVDWKTDRGTRVPSWSSPVLVEHEGHEILVISSADTVDAYDVSNGELYWSIEGLQGNHIPSATVVDGRIYVGSTSMFHKAADDAGVAGSNCCIELTMEDGKPGYQVRWGAERANSYYSTPLAFAGYVYYVNKAGVLYCIDQETGERRFATRIGNPCWASAIGVETSAGEKLVYFVMKNGFAIILRPGDEYERVARNQLWDVEEMRAAAEAAEKHRRENKASADQRQRSSPEERMLDGMPEGRLHEIFGYGDPTVYGTAVAGSSLLVRTGQHLYCVRQHP